MDMLFQKKTWLYGFIFKENIEGRIMCLGGWKYKLGGLPPFLEQEPCVLFLNIYEYVLLVYSSWRLVSSLHVEHVSNRLIMFLSGWFISLVGSRKHCSINYYFNKKFYDLKYIYISMLFLYLFEMKFLFCKSLWSF